LPVKFYDDGIIHNSKWVAFFDSSFLMKWQRVNYKPADLVYYGNHDILLAKLSDNNWDIGEMEISSYKSCIFSFN